MTALRLQERWVAAIVALGVSVLILPPMSAGAASSPLMRLARYAANTAIHASPARSVTGADVLNAFDTPSLNPPLSTGVLSVMANLGDLPGAPRGIMVENPSTYQRTCVKFPVGIGASPREVTCPMLAFTLWSDEPNVLYASRNAVATAAQQGRSVSGADVVKAARASNLRLANEPTFPSGKGGIVTFVATLKTNSEVVTGHLCVSMPRQRYGIPLVVTCRS
jgi:hypothetical protein